MIGARAAGLAALALAAAGPAAAHQFNVYASVDCEAITVEATLENGRAPATGEVLLRDGSDAVIGTHELGDTGTRRIPLEGLDAAGGVRVEVRSGDHADYWVLTPEDIARGCTS